MIQAIQAGDSGYNVRQSRIAIIRALRTKDAKGTRKLRRRLRLERRRSVATATWADGVRRWQRLNRVTATGRIDMTAYRRLRKFWPRDSLGRRLVRRTPAWRLIPGQLTPNFNVREFVCHNGTGYIGGLSRETGISRKDARARARKLAQRLERVRAALRHPLHLTSVYRTRAYNAAIGGATNSAHTRGYAADVPPPSGIGFTRHARTMRAVFECGVGQYPRSGFVHGDFDPTLGRRDWTG